MTFGVVAGLLAGARVTVSPVPVIAAAVCPYPPLLVPRLAAGAAAELDGVRAACDAALRRLRDCGAPGLVVVGVDDATRWLEPPYGGTFAPWGEAVEVPPADGGLPLSLLVGGWLLHRGAVAGGAAPTGGARPGPDTGLAPDIGPVPDLGPVRMLTVAADASPADCVALGQRLAAGDPVALLVMGDGSACRSEKAPGYHDPRAGAFDTEVADALAAGDPQRLAALDPVLASELRAAGRAPWQVLAAAAAASRPDRRWDAVLHCAEAPYGVGYFVASWL